MKTDGIIARVLPQFFPKHWLDNPGVVFTDFPSRIRIGYVLRDKNSYSYVMDEELSLLRISLDELHAASIANLARLPSGKITIAEVPGCAEGFLSATDDNFAAVRILLPTIQQEFREALGEEFLLSIPHRDDCFCWSVAQPVDRQQRHARQALEDFLQDDYNLTPDILRFSNEGFRLHIEQVSA